MAITRTPMIDDDGTGTTGTIINNAWKQEFYNQIDAQFGAWLDVPYTPANFIGAGSTVWTVQSSDQVTFTYLPIGGAVVVLFNIVGSSISGAAGSPLRIILPIPTPPSRNTDAFCWGLDNSVSIAVRVRVIAGDSSLYLYRADFANWAISADGTSMSGQVIIRV